MCQQIIVRFMATFTAYEDFSTNNVKQKRVFHTTESRRAFKIFGRYQSKQTEYFTLPIEKSFTKYILTFHPNFSLQVSSAKRAVLA